MSQREVGATYSFLEKMQGKGVNTGINSMGPPKVMKTWDKFLKKFRKAKDSVKSFINFFDKFGVVQPFVELFGGWLEILGSAFTPLIEKLIPLFNTLTPWIQKFADILAKILGFLLSGEAWKEAGEMIKNFFKGIGDWFKQIWTNVKDWFSTHIIDPIKNFFRGLLNAVIGFINVIIRGVNHLIPGKRWDINELEVVV